MGIPFDLDVVLQGKAVQLTKGEDWDTDEDLGRLLVLLVREGHKRLLDLRIAYFVTGELEPNRPCVVVRAEGHTDLCREERANG